MEAEGKPGKGKGWQKKRCGIGRQCKKKKQPFSSRKPGNHSDDDTMCPHSLSLKLAGA